MFFQTFFYRNLKVKAWQNMKLLLLYKYMMTGQIASSQGTRVCLWLQISLDFIDFSSYCCFFQCISDCQAFFLYSVPTWDQRKAISTDSSL